MTARTVLDRSHPLPLWAQILRDLRRRMVAGEFDDRFPTDETLKKEYGVSRQTVREAVRRLQADGVVVRERGRGTMLSGSELEQPLRSLYSLARTIEAQGFRERSEVLSLEVGAAGELAATLGMRKHDKVLSLERIRFVDDEPLALERSWLPANLAGRLVDADLTAGSLYDALAVHCGVAVTGGWERIRPLVPPERERALLRLPDGEAVFAVERLVQAGDRPVEWRFSLVRGDRYSFRAEWSGPPGVQDAEFPSAEWSGPPGV